MDSSNSGEEFRALIKAKRAELGWSQTAANSECRFPAARYHKIERGQREPSPAEAIKIASVLGIQFTNEEQGND